jgi:hypothetical protein
MKTQGKTLDPRCREIRHRLPDFLREELGVVATGEVQGHLLSCQACSEVYAELLMQEVESEAEPLRTPPRIPPSDWYDAYLRGRSGRFGILWSSLREARQSAAAAVRDWAREQTEKIGSALRRLLAPPAVVRVRGAVRTRGTATKKPSALFADVLSSAWEPTGQTVSFTIVEPPHITADGHFRLRLRTQAMAYEGHSVICTVALPEMLSISFRGTLRDGEVEIDEEGIPCVEGNIELEQVRVALMKGQFTLGK